MTSNRDQWSDGVESVRSACLEALGAIAATRVSVWSYNPRSETFSPFVATGVDVPGTDLTRRWARTAADDIPALALAVATRAPVVIDDPETAGLPDSLVEDFALESVWIAPLEAGGRITGVVCVEPAAAADRQALRSLVPLLARAMGEARAWRLVEQQRAEVELLLELGEASLAQTSAEALGALWGTVGRHLGVDRATVFVLSEGELGAGAAPDVVADVLARWSPVVRHDAPSTLALPFGAEDDPIGILVLEDAKPRRFTEPVVRLATAAAGQLGRIWERAEVAEDHARRHASAAATRRLLQEGSRAASVADASEVIARVGRDALDVDHAVAYLVDDDGVIDQIIAVEVEESWQARLRQWTLGIHATDLALGRLQYDERQPLVVHDVVASGLLPDALIEALALRTLIAIPLLAHGRFRGTVVYSAARGPRRWTLDDRYLVEQLFLESSIVLENAELRSAERAHTERLAHLALHDPLTGLPNRVLLADRLDAALAQRVPAGHAVGVLFVDVTSFKEVNDRYGHDAGDIVLQEIAARLQAATRSGDTVARLAGDEFVVVLPVVADGEARAIAARIVDAFEPPIMIGERVVTVGASVGLAVSQPGVVTASELLARADAAMYQAKRERGAGHAVFESPRCSAADGDAP